MVGPLDTVLLVALGVLALVFGALVFTLNSMARVTFALLAAWCASAGSRPSSAFPIWAW